MPQLMITDRLHDKKETLPDRGRDILKMDALNALEGPLLARLSLGDYEILDIEVETALVRIHVGGPSQVICFSEISVLFDINGTEYDPEDFWEETP